MGEQQNGFVPSRSSTEPGRSPGPLQQPNERSDLAPRFLRRCHRTNIDVDARRVQVRRRRRVKCRREPCTVVDDVELLLWRRIVRLEMFDEIDGAIIDHLKRKSAFIYFGARLAMVNTYLVRSRTEDQFPRLL